MRLNKFIARYSGISRRAADDAIAAGRVTVNGLTANIGQTVDDNADKVTLDGRAITPDVKSITIMFHKPIGYVCSRNGQGNATIYDLLPAKYRTLKTIGRLDKDSSGLLLLTNDGDMANQLSHPGNHKQKVYEVQLNKPLGPKDVAHINNEGVALDDGISRLTLKKLNNDTAWQITMHEGRNRQIRRTFEALGYSVTQLHRVGFGPYLIGGLKPGQTMEVAL